MSSLSRWIADKLTEQSAVLDGPPQPQGGSALRVSRTAGPDVVVACTDLSRDGLFRAEHVDQVLDATPAADAIIVVRAQVATTAEARAFERGVIAGPLGLVAAALSEPDLTDFLPREQEFVLRRLSQHRAVDAVRRIGFSTFELSRGALRTLAVATTDEYELTADHVLTILEVHEGQQLDAIAVSNPNVYDIGEDAVEAGEDAGVQVMTLRDLRGTLSQPWT